MGRNAELLRSFRFRPRVAPLPPALEPVDLAWALGALRGVVARPALLDSVAGRPGRASLLAFDPLPLPAPDSMADLRRFAGALEEDGGDRPPEFFSGGFLGVLAYEALVPRGLRRTLPSDPLGCPPIQGGVYTDFLLRDERTGRTVLCLAEDPGDGRAAVEERREALLEALRQGPGSGGVRARGPLRRHVSEQEHRSRIEAARREIARGEIYQANLTQRFSADLEGHPVDLYRRLRRLHPAPYAGYLELEGGALLSASPELLLEFDPHSRPPLARTRPIKGTAPRHSDPAQDRARARALLASEKDLAELTMIVDLERNDLGRVARTGSVAVESLPRLESYATVHHLVADVVARPRRGVDALRCLAALFPGGSVTGAPKVRAMEVIADLEGEGRGYFYGSLLALDRAGRMRANLTIRTLVWQGDEGGGTATYRVGGGITWASRAADEEAECHDKARALAASLTGHTAGLP